MFWVELASKVFLLIVLTPIFVILALAFWAVVIVLYAYVQASMLLIYEWLTDTFAFINKPKHWSEIDTDGNHRQ